MTLLSDIWKIYSDNNFTDSFSASVQALADAAGIDMLHIAGLSLMGLHRQDEAMILLKAAVTLRPQSAHIYSNAAYIAEQAGRTDDVRFFTDRGLSDFPDDCDLMLMKANCFVMGMRFDEAEALYRQLLERIPDHVPSLINLGNIARAHEDFVQAERYFDQVEEIAPDYRDLVFARATMWSQRGEDEKATKLLEPIAFDMEAQFLLALLYMSRGDYDRGFRYYRARKHTVWYHTGNFVYPLNPFDHYTDATDKNIAIIQEGGFGDLIQFYRYIPMLAKVAKSISFFAPPNMVRLFYDLPDNVILKPSYDQLGQYDYITTDVEMPYHFRTTLDTVPNDIPYIFVPKEEIARHILPHAGARRVGLCWAGGPRDNLNQRSYDGRRSMDLKMLRPLADIRGIEFVSLQFGSKADELGMDLIRVIEPSFDFLDTAAIIAQLDLVISVDTSVVHLAAAMGKPTWLLSRYDCCWRWLKNTHSPWYPNIRIFGQKSYADWSVPLVELKIALEQWAAN